MMKGISDDEIHKNAGIHVFKSIPANRFPEKSP
jgi:hypothetical protein